jgi:hypothetical protein
MLADDYLSTYDVSDSVAVVVDAGIAETWVALMSVDLIEVGRRRPLVGVLGTVRMLPDLVNRLLHGERPTQPAHLRLRDLTSLPLGQGGWVLLECREQDEIALGLVGKFWKPVIEFAEVSSADGFRAFAQSGFAKTVYALSVRAIDQNRTLLAGAMRTATTSADARRWFRRYWTFGVGSGAHLLVHGLLDVTRELAEQRIAGDRRPPPADGAAAR